MILSKVVSLVRISAWIEKWENLLARHICENMVTGKNMSHEAVLKIVVKDIIVSDCIRFLGKPVVVRVNYLLEYT